MPETWYDEEDRRLLRIIGTLAEREERMPESVVEAAKAMHDWARMDAAVAEFTQQAVLTRSAEDGYHTFATGGLTIRVEVEPAGYRRRRIAVVAVDEKTQQLADEVTVQLSNGTSVSVGSDAFGERITKVPSGTIRVVAVAAAGAVVTPWFTV